MRSAEKYIQPITIKSDVAVKEKKEKKIESNEAPLQYIERKSFIKTPKRLLSQVDCTITTYKETYRVFN